MYISAVVPVYEAEGCLQNLYDRLRKSLEKISADFEIIMVDDCSKDRSWKIMSELSKLDRRIRPIRLSRNFGQHNALLCGIRAARGEIIVTLDDDLQHPPEEIPKLLNKLLEGPDVVYGTPDKEQHGFWRNAASQLTKIVLKGIMGAGPGRSVSTFRLFRAKVREAFVDYDGTFVSIDVLLSWGTERFSAVTVKYNQRKVGKSNYSLKKLVIHALNMITGFSVWPLQLASLTGFAFTLLGLIILAYVVGRYLIQGAKVPGFTFLASIVTIFSGAQLFALGVIGEYLARIHFRTIKRPSYIIRGKINYQKDENDFL